MGGCVFDTTDIHTYSHAQVRVVFPDRTVTVYRRYSDFHRLHEHLKMRGFAGKLAPFPPKKIFTRSQVGEEFKNIVWRLWKA